MNSTLAAPSRLSSSTQVLLDEKLADNAEAMGKIFRGELQVPRDSRERKVATCPGTGWYGPLK